MVASQLVVASSSSISPFCIFLSWCYFWIKNESKNGKCVSTCRALGARLCLLFSCWLKILIYFLPIRWCHSFLIYSKNSLGSQFQPQFLIWCCKLCIMAILIMHTVLHIQKSVGHACDHEEKEKHAKQILLIYAIAHRERNFIIKSNFFFVKIHVISRNDWLLRNWRWSCLFNFCASWRKKSLSWSNLSKNTCALQHTYTQILFVPFPLSLSLT